MRSGVPALVCGLSVVLLLLLGCSASEADAPSGVADGRPAPAAGGDAAVAVRVVQVEPADLQRLSVFSGRIRPAAERLIAARVPGRVDAVHVDVGDAVATDDLLIALDSRDAELQARQARAQLNQLEIRQRQAVQDLRRLEQLHAGGAATDRELEFTRTEVAALGAQIEAARAALDLAQKAVDESLIRAPGGGIVAARRVEQGAFVAAGTPLLTLVDIDTVYLEITVPEQHIHHVLPGAAVRVKVQALQAEFTGAVASVSPVMEAGGSGYQTRIRIANPDQRIRGGMFAEVELATEQVRDALAIPAGAVLSRGGNEVVFVVEADRAVMRPVVLGLRSQNQVSVQEGLAAGEWVVVEGQHRLSDGEAVRVAGGD